MKKTMTFDEMENIHIRLNEEWPTAVKELHLSNKSLYNLITLKKAIEDKHYALQETMGTIMRSHGAEEDERGALRVPKEKIEEVNKAFIELAGESTDIDVEEIHVRETDSIPSVIMEILYDFIIID